MKFFGYFFEWIESDLLFGYLRSYSSFILLINISIRENIYGSAINRCRRYDIIIEAENMNKKVSKLI
jgi:hypothetical protein